VEDHCGPRHQPIGAIGDFDDQRLCQGFSHSPAGTIALDYGDVCGLPLAGKNKAVSPAGGQHAEAYHTNDGKLYHAVRVGREIPREIGPTSHDAVSLSKEMF
jgi:hypothetical protein